jgi:hypothetical protein
VCFLLGNFRQAVLEVKRAQLLADQMPWLRFVGLVFRNATGRLQSDFGRNLDIGKPGLLKITDDPKPVDGMDGGHAASALSLVHSRLLRWPLQVEQAITNPSRSWLFVRLPDSFDRRWSSVAALPEMEGVCGR